MEEDGWRIPKSVKSDWDGRTNNFDFLRLALAILVIFSHCHALGLGSESSEPVLRFTHGQISGGTLAVDLFFVMSGFLITASAERSNGLLSFLKKRVRRIYPGFCVAAIVTAIVCVPVGAVIFAYDSWGQRGGDFLLQSLRLREFHYVAAFPHNPYPNVINGSTWSIPYEFWCYIGVALLTAAGWLRKRWLISAFFAASLVVSVLFQAEGWILGGKLLGLVLGPPQIWARMLPLYLAGVVFYLFRSRIPLNGGLALGSAAALLCAAWAPFGCTVLLPLMGTYLVLYLAFAPWLRLQHFGRFGDFSYGTYLYAFPIQQILMKWFGHPAAPALLFVCATPLTLAMAVASWYGVERRFLQPVRRKGTLVHAIESEEAGLGTAEVQPAVSSGSTDA